MISGTILEGVHTWLITNQIGKGSWEHLGNNFTSKNKNKKSKTDEIVTISQNYANNICFRDFNVNTSPILSILWSIGRLILGMCQVQIQLAKSKHSNTDLKISYVGGR